MLYYSERKKITNGSAVAPVYHTDEDRDAMERQFHLNCANVLDKTLPRNDMDVCEWGTIEKGVIERRVYTKNETPQQNQGNQQQE